jgi:hypothetical protein
MFPHLTRQEFLIVNSRVATARRLPRAGCLTERVEPAVNTVTLPSTGTALGSSSSSARTLPWRSGVYRARRQRRLQERCDHGGRAEGREGRTATNAFAAIAMEYSETNEGQTVRHATLAGFNTLATKALTCSRENNGSEHTPAAPGIQDRTDGCGGCCCRRHDGCGLGGFRGRRGGGRGGFVGDLSFLTVHGAIHAVSVDHKPEIGGNQIWTMRTSS